MATTEEDPEPEEEAREEIQTGSLIIQSLPHKYDRDAIEFSVEEFQLDGEPLGERGEVDESDRFLSLVDESSWGTLTIAGEIEVQEDTIQEVFPPEEWEEPPGRLTLVKTNRLAIHRSRTVLAEPPIADGARSFEVTIGRSQHRGTVHLEPFLTRTRAEEPGATNCATKSGARLSNGVPWTIQLDEPSDGGGLLMPIIEDFENRDRFPDDKHIHYLNLDEPRNPQLYLNSGHPRVSEVLDNDGATGGPPRLRDLLYDYIEHSVWTQLIIQTARDTDTDTGETRYDWEEDVLDIFLDDLYPELDEKQATVQLATDIRSVEDLPSLMDKIERAVHQQYDIPDDTTKLVEEAIQSDD